MKKDSQKLTQKVKKIEWKKSNDLESEHQLNQYE